MYVPICTQRHANTRCLALAASLWLPRSGRLSLAASLWLPLGECVRVSLGMSFQGSCDFAGVGGLNLCKPFWEQVVKGCCVVLVTVES